MKYEVELKYRLADAAPLRAQLAELHAVAGTPTEQTDRYFNHPERDFRDTDEALRIRSAGTDRCITYKGPKIDSQTKTRREIEIPVGRDDRDIDQFAELLAALGFREVVTVQKRREPFSVDWQGRPFEICLDQVDGLGSFIELETSATAETLDAARQAALDLAHELHLSETERRGYAQILLEGLGR